MIADLPSKLLQAIISSNKNADSSSSLIEGSFSSVEKNLANVCPIFALVDTDLYLAIIHGSRCHLINLGRVPSDVVATCSITGKSGKY